MPGKVNLLRDSGLACLLNQFSGIVGFGKVRAAQDYESGLRVDPQHTDGCLQNTCSPFHR